MTGRRYLQLFGYFVATLFVLGGTALLIAYGNGYSYDFKTGRLLHRGLIIIDSVPSGATMMLHGKVIRQQTPYRQAFVAGSYDFTLTKAGYRTWNKRLQSIPSQVTLADYVLLLPQHLPANAVGTYAGITQFVASTDHKRIAYVVPSGPTPGVWSLDTGNNQQTHLYAPAVATATTPAETASIVGWSKDDSHLLLQTQLGDKTSMVVVASNGTDAPVNITDTLNVPATGLTFNSTNWQQLYWQSPEGLRRIDLGNQTVSEPLANHVAAYSFAQGRIVYVDASKSPASLWAMNSDGSGKQKLVAKLPPSTAYQVAYISYLGTDEVALVAQDSRTTTLYSGIYDHPVAKTLSATGTQALFSTSGRYLLLSDESHVATYDLQRGATYTMSAINSSVTGLNWFDDNHLEFNRNGEVILGEFDGNYAIAITRGNGLAPYSSPDGKNVLVTATTSTGNAVIKAIKVRQ